MNASLRKVGALLHKDLVDLFKNPGMSVGLLLPVAMVALQCWLAIGASGDALTGEHAAEAQAMISPVMLLCSLCMAVGMVGSMAVLYSIAEEREKNTLRTLTLSNVSAAQIVVAKSLVALVGMALAELACFAVVWFAIGADLGLLVPYLALGAVAAVPVLLASLVLGLACRDQMTAGFYSVPVVLLTMAPMFGLYSEGIRDATRFLPLGAAGDLLDLMVEGQLLSAEALAPVAVLAMWIVAGAALFGALFARLTRDN